MQQLKLAQCNGFASGELTSIAPTGTFSAAVFLD